MLRFHATDGSTRRSSEWSVVIKPPDLYLSARSLMGDVKASLHGSGHCHHAITRRAADAIGEELTPRLDEWRHELPRARQWTPIYTVKLHSGQFVEWPDPPHPASNPLTVAPGSVAVVAFVLLGSGVRTAAKPMIQLVHAQLSSEVTLEVLWIDHDEDGGVRDRVVAEVTHTFHQHPEPLARQSLVGYGFTEDDHGGRGAFEFRGPI